MTQRSIWFGILGIALLACSDETTSAPPKNTDEDERGSVGAPPPPAEYCQKLGYELQGSTCVFPDGTSCDEWQFYYGLCGQANSYCNKHGGSVANESRNMGTYTASVAVCTLGDKKCDEATFFSSGKCE